MREIKFRFWNQEENKMIYNAEETYDYGASGVPIMEENFGLLLKNSGEYIMQYVGIKDKDGKEIYEGDIICNDNGCKYVVIWLKNECCYVQSRIINSLFATENGKGEMLDIRYNLKTLIGNIYENPELLEG